MDRDFNDDRKVIPRWRSLSRTPSKELDSVHDKKQPITENFLDDRIRFLYEIWRERPTLENALTVIECAATTPDRPLVIGPARMIINSGSAMPASKAIASLVLSGPKTLGIFCVPDSFDKNEIQSKIKDIKVRLYSEPRNALLWLEKARLNTELGHVKTAQKDIQIAANYAPNNRFVLRGYSRFMVHIDKPEFAHRTLLKADAIKSDPWIQAAEIVTAEEANLPSKYAKIARTTVERGDLAPIHTSELASAIATLETNSGNARKARRLFDKSLIMPTDNSLSQALWAREKRAMNLQFTEKALSLHCAYEARTRVAEAEKRWDKAITFCTEWLHDEPFSVIAAAEGSYIASANLWQHDIALWFAEQGLIANPNSRTLLNNKAVSLCRLGRLEDAKNTLSKIKAENDPYPTATKGLHAFRSGDYELGRIHYETAIRFAKEKNDADTILRAFVNWIYEEAKSNSISKQDIAEFSGFIEDYVNRPVITRPTKNTWDAIKNRMAEQKFGRSEASGGSNIREARKALNG